MIKVRRYLSLYGVCVSVVYFVTFILVMPFVGRELPFSFYRSSSWTTESMQMKAMMDNTIQYESAVSHLKTRDQHLQINAPSFHNKINIHIVVVTVPRAIGRQPLGYLTRTVDSLDERIRTNDVIDGVHLSICNVNAGPGMHPELETLRKLFIVADRFPNGSATAAIMDPFEKEKEDYVFCMQEALNHTSNMVLIVEDDAVARPDLFHVIRWILASERTTKSWSYIKLFYPERWQGYSADPRTLLELSSFFVIGGALGLSLYFAFASRRTYRPQRHSIRQFIVSGMYCVLVVLTVGRQHMINIKRLSPSLHSLAPAPACCSPAILYFSGFATELTRHLSNDVRCSKYLPLDLAIHEFAQATAVTGYLVEPNLFRHIGLLSTMKGYSNYPEDFLI